VSRTALGPTQPPIQRVPGALSVGIKRPEREVDHSPPSSAEVECVELYLHFPKRFHGVVLSYAQGQVKSVRFVANVTVPTVNTQGGIPGFICKATNLSIRGLLT
jgi:hypothetical protein